ncbi:hypothetical protein [Paramagnetospirillum marisnigri]|nr:hypothetical protein [Paramagnetospirillum marisnigri]
MMLSPLAFAWMAGFLCGALIGWNLAEFTPVPMLPAALLAGDASYLPGSPMGLIHAKTVSAITQLIALLMKIGWSDNAVIRTIYAVQAGLLASGSVLVVFGFCRRAFASLAASVLFVAMLPFCGKFGYSDYIMLSLSPSTYGMVGHALILYVVGLLAIGRSGPALFGLGVLLASHPVLGAWCALALVLALLPERHRGTTAALLPLLPWGVAGGALVLLSFLTRPGAPEADMGINAAEAIRYRDAFIALWDYHRNVDLSPLRGMAVVQALALAGLGLVMLRLGGEGGHGLGPRRALRIIVLMAVAGAASFTLYHFARPLFPTVVTALLMPSRFLNIPLLLTFPLVAAVMLSRSGNPLVWGMAGIMAAVLAIAPLENASTLEPVAGVVLILAASASVATRWGQLDLLTRMPWPTKPWSAAGSMLAMLGVVTVVGGVTTAILHKPLVVEDPVVDKVRALVSPPVLFSSRYSQLAYWRLFPRHAPALDVDSLDYITYVPEAAGEISRMLADVYGIDYFNPPYRFLPAVHMDEHVRERWERFSPQDWRFLADNYGFHTVVTLHPWLLSIPRKLSYRMGQHTLYVYQIVR